MPGSQTTGGEAMLQTVARVLRARGLEGWLVGGTVRDRQLGRYSPDLDVVVTGDPAVVAAEVARELGSPWFALSERHGAYRVVAGHANVDVAAVRGDGILADLALRDFTVNAMAIPVEGGEWLDPFGGRDDLLLRRLQAVSDRIFDDDPLRLMRAPRFAHVLGLRMAPRLADAVRAKASILWRAAPERIAKEMILTLAAGDAGSAVRLWRDLGLLEVVIPELGIPDGGGHYPALEGLEQELTDLSGWFPDEAGLLERRLCDPVDGAVERKVALRLAALLRGLEPQSARQVGRRLKLSSPLISLLQTSAAMKGYEDDVGGSGGPDTGLARAATGLGDSAAVPGRATVLYLWAASPWEPEAILLVAAAAQNEMHLNAAKALMSAWARRETLGVPMLPFDGLALMEELRLAPDPRLGRALRAARLAWEAGEATTADQALAAAREGLNYDETARAGP